MPVTPVLPSPDVIVYPDCDGKPMADNTKQLRWIVMIFDNLAALFAHRSDVFVGANQFWYPVQGHPEIIQAPDPYVVFGRPKGDRPSCKQWEEDGIPLTVIFEILSPGNTIEEMDDKLIFYEDHGVEEYYIYNPDTNRLTVYVRTGDLLQRVRPVHNFSSPRLGITFDLSGEELVIRGPNGEPFLTFEELRAERAAARSPASEARQQAARLAELSRKARRGQAGAEELQELDRLEAQSLPPAS